jgi:hypothetical protein
MSCPVNMLTENCITPSGLYFMERKVTALFLPASVPPIPLPLHSRGFSTLPGTSLTLFYSTPQCPSSVIQFLIKVMKHHGKKA